MVVGWARKGFWFGPIGVSYVFVTVCRTRLFGDVSCGSGVAKMDGGSEGSGIRRSGLGGWSATVWWDNHC